jgi:hypothetical protein
VKIVRIAWLTDYNPMEASAAGGALSDRACIVEGIKRGYKFEVVNKDTLRTVGIANFDLMVISNAHFFNLNELYQASRLIPYVFYSHDYFSLCQFKLFYPMEEKCKSCKSLPFTRQLLLNSALNIFLSPLHLEAWSYAIPELKDHPYHLHVSPVDVELFKPVEGVKRISNSVLGVNSLVRFKGASKVLEYVRGHPELVFTFIGAKDEDIVLPSNAHFLGYVANSTMPELYSQAEYFLHLPQNASPCERTAIEAKLCGVPKLILNENVGVTSYPEFNLPIERFRDWIKNSPKRFWDKIEGSL